MSYSRLGRKLAWIAVAVAAIIVISPLAFFSEAGEVFVIPLGVGVLLLGAALTYLQLSFWREGDASSPLPTNLAIPQIQEVDDARTGARTGTTLLYVPRLQRVWRNVDESKRLVERREREEDARRRGREKVRLRLAAEEDILFLGEPSLWLYWPAVLLSGIALATSVWRASGTAASFLGLFVGLAGLLVVSVCRAWTTYYLTNYRVLVRKRRLWQKDRWLALRYESIERFDWHNGVLGTKLTFYSNAEQTEIRGLAGKAVAVMNRILQEQMPAEAYAKCTRPDLLSRPVL